PPCRGRADRTPSSCGSSRMDIRAPGNPGSSCAGAPGRRTARTSSRVLRQVEHALGDDVALHLGGARVDRARPRPEELARPVDIRAGLGAGTEELAARAEEIERGLAE